MRRSSQHLNRGQNDDAYDDNNDGNSFVPPSQKPGQKQGCANRLGYLVTALALVLVLLGGSLIIVEALLPSSLMQNLVVMNGDIKIAQVSVNPSHLRRHYNTVQITFFDNDGHPSYDSNCNNCIMQGDGVQLQASIVNLPWWLKLFWHYAGCKLTSLKSKLSAQPTVAKTLRGGEDSSFQTVQNLGGEVTSSDTVWIPANGKLYNVFISPDGHLYDELAS